MVPPGIRAGAGEGGEGDTGKNAPWRWIRLETRVGPRAPPPGSTHLRERGGGAATDTPAGTGGDGTGGDGTGGDRRGREGTGRGCRRTAPRGTGPPLQAGTRTEPPPGFLLLPPCLSSHSPPPQKKKSRGAAGGSTGTQPPRGR